MTSGSETEPTAEEISAALVPQIPIVWMLGKTGAGKSTLVQRLTGTSLVEIGNGFEPCTRRSLYYDHPPKTPLLRFLDTRGLGEAGYDPTEDLAMCEGHSHAIVVLARLDDPVQGAVADALAAAMKRRPKQDALLVHTGGDLIAEDAARARARAANAALFEKAAGRNLRQVEVILKQAECAPKSSIDPEDGLDALVEHLSEMLPTASLALARQEAATAEQSAFADIRPRVLTYATAAGASDVLPVVGLASVPALQFAMLRDLALHYDTVWTRKLFATFVSALGLGVAMRFGGSFGTRQLAKLIPIYGQTIGAAAAGTVSFASTYALGRAAALYLHHHAMGKPPSPEDLRDAFRSALQTAANVEK
jgi:uncharacterized protein (DUF697 family)